MERLRAAGRALARRHQRTPGTPVIPSLIDYAEIPRIDDWSLRSALVRVAQREPVLAGQILEAVRRCDAALHPYRRVLETHGTTTDRALALDRSAATDGEPLPDEPVDPVADTRAADLARLVRSLRPDPTTGDDDGPAQLAAAIGAVAAGYREVAELDDDEVTAAPLLVAALDLDELATVATEWAVTTAEPLPVAELDRLRQLAWAALDDAGAPREEGRPPPGARSRRG